MTKDIKSFLHYYIGTGAEVEYEYRGNKEIKELTSYRFSLLDQVIKRIKDWNPPIRFTNLISIDELTDEQKVKLYDKIYSPELTFALNGESDISDADKVWSIELAVNEIRYSPALFHELLQMRVDLFNLKETS